MDNEKFKIKKDNRFSTAEKILYNIMLELEKLNNKDQVKISKNIAKKGK